MFVKYAVNEDGKTAFSLVVEKGHSHLYDMLHLGDALHRAARIDDVHAMKSCIAEGGNVNGKDQNGCTALHRAAFKGRIESVKTLVSNGAQIDLLDDGGYTSFRLEVEGGHMQIAIYLIAHGAKANVVKNNSSLKDFEMVPFNLNCFKNHPSLVTTPLCREKERA
ncbi:Ankyrin repeat domain-containing protein 6 [Camellia lanceoleosa]|uniref:Ankyrin repeat domain-containing protein 6 n=1 Tax=Camellia lanceoleosa TaxID=1840588 RepID=A0ACC0F6P2_9ERIC|nr:Ankyrin repeat domain-containing protein 6 [Camellia lanceoleosa]